jgi:branched-chain amino acid aminotransferase
MFAYTKPYFGFNSSNTATVCLAHTVLRTPDSSINQIHKNFAWNDLTKAQWEAIDRGYDTAILENHEGFITEGPGFNVGIIVGECIIAPKTNRLQGTVMDLVQKANTKFSYTDISFSDIMNADAMFLTSTAGNVIQVTKFEDKEFKENRILSWLMSNI